MKWEEGDTGRHCTGAAAAAFAQGEKLVIRQAISCDICGTEMQHTNHWFVANAQAGELRVSVWNSRNRLRAGAKHLCGQTCLHKLVDDFLAKSVAARVQSVAEKTAAEDEVPRLAPVRTDSSLTSSTFHPAALRQPAPVAQPYVDEFESSARLITLPESAGKGGAEPAVEPPGFAARNWRAEAWKREREREQCKEHRAGRHRSIA